MKTEVMMHAVVSAGLLPPTRSLVRNYLLQVAALMGGEAAIEPQARGAFVLLPQCGVLLVGTACRAPLLQPEAHVVGLMMNATVLLLRVEADRGVSADIRFAGHTHWLCNYRLEYGKDGLSLVPPLGGKPNLLVTGEGVTVEAANACTASFLRRSEGGNA